MRHSRLVFVVALLAMTVVGFAMLGPGAAQPWIGAEVWGGPWGDSRALSLRVVLVERHRDVARSAARVPIEIRAGTGSSSVAARATTNEDGVADALLTMPGGGGTDRVAIAILANARTVASGVLVPPFAWGQAARGCDLPGTRSGRLHIAVAAARGVFAAPFPDAVALRVTAGDRPIAGATVHVDALGAEVLDDPSATTDVSGRTSFLIRPTSHEVEVRFDARSGALEGSFAGALPVVPGAMWLDPGALASGELRVVSPVPRSLSYVTLATEQRRIWGGSVPLVEGTGRVPLPAGASDEHRGCLWATVASDPSARGSGTVGWPMEAVAPRNACSCGERRFADALLFDGTAQGRAREDARRVRARWLALTALIAVAVIEGLLLYLSTADATRDLARLEQAARGAKLGARRAVLGLLVALATLVLAVVAVGVVMLWRTGG